ncbi:MAG: ComEC/Rec2 family competence protein [bacterium]|nr:ComEC/Rec2 family competence protein [bacterium]MDT8366062.1 ComEC/Rec2 family competence protein [bacterium]
MNSSTDHPPSLKAAADKRINDHRPFLPCAPAVIMAVCLLIGCLFGRFTLKQDQRWLSIAMPAICVLALVQPSILALSAAGIISGITLENLKRLHLHANSRFYSMQVTVKGTVVGKTPSLYGQNTLTVRVSEVWGSGRETVNFLLRVSVPVSEEIMQGEEIIMRTVLHETGPGIVPLVINGSIVTGGWQAGPRALSTFFKGRERLVKVLRTFKGSSTSGLLGAISLGERWQVGVRTRDILQKTGTYHLLAISGVHVGAAILPFLLILRLCASTLQRVNPRVVRGVFLIFSVFAVAIYMCFTGLSASALRAVVYFILVGSAVLPGRNSSPMTSLSLCVLLLVCFSSDEQPDVSLVLSALAVTGIVLSSRGLGGRGLSSGWGGNFIKGSMQMTMGAILFTLPMAVWLAGGISIIAPIGNLVAGVPFSLFLIPVAVLIDSAALFPWFPLEPLINIWLEASGLILMFMAHLADLPLSFQRLSPAGCLIASLTALVGVLVWQQKKYRLNAGIAIFIIILAVSGTGEFFNEKINRDDLVISFPMVGQADAAIITFHGKTVLIDCGPRGFPGRDSPVARALQRQGVRNLEAIFLSHLHPDHAGGLEDIMAKWPVQVIYLPEGSGLEEDRSISPGRTFTDTSVQGLRYGEVVKLSSMVFTVLGTEEKGKQVKDVNRGSLQLLLEIEGFRALFTGDAGWDQVQRSLGRIHSLDLLKVPHHGSKSGFPPAGLDDAVSSINSDGNFIAVCPSRSPGNSHLPAPEVVQWFEGKGIKLVFTGDTIVKIRYKKGGPFEVDPLLLTTMFGSDN